MRLSLLSMSLILSFTVAMPNAWSTANKELGRRDCPAGQVTYRSCVGGERPSEEFNKCYQENGCSGEHVGTDGSHSGDVSDDRAGVRLRSYQTNVDVGSLVLPNVVVLKEFVKR
jgi:hypothetical protein